MDDGSLWEVFQLVFVSSLKFLFHSSPSQFDWRYRSFCAPWPSSALVLADLWMNFFFLFFQKSPPPALINSLTHTTKGWKTLCKWPVCAPCVCEDVKCGQVRSEKERKVLFFEVWCSISSFARCYCTALRFLLMRPVCRPFWNANTQQTRPLMLFQLIDSGPFFGLRSLVCVCVCPRSFRWLYELFCFFFSIFFFHHVSFKYISTYWYILMAWLFIIIIIIVHSWPLVLAPALRFGTSRSFAFDNGLLSSRPRPARCVPRERNGRKKNTTTEMSNLNFVQSARALIFLYI